MKKKSKDLHEGKVYERFVKSAKECLRKTAGKAKGRMPKLVETETFSVNFFDVIEAGLKRSSLFKKENVTISSDEINFIKI